MVSVAHADIAPMPPAKPVPAKPAPAKPMPAPAKPEPKPADVTANKVVVPAKPNEKPAAPMEMPKPAPEMTAMIAAQKGTWKCKGTMMMPDGSSVPMNAKITNKAEMGGYWMRTNFVQPGKTGFVFEAMTAFQPATKNWYRSHADNMGSHEETTADLAKDNKMVWTGTSTSPMGTASARHYEEMAGKEVKMWGEYSMDKGKTWMKAYECTCTR